MNSKLTEELKTTVKIIKSPIPKYIHEIAKTSAIFHDIALDMTTPEISTKRYAPNLSRLKHASFMYPWSGR